MRSVRPTLLSAFALIILTHTASAITTLALLQRTPHPCASMRMSMFSAPCASEHLCAHVRLTLFGASERCADRIALMRGHHLCASAALLMSTASLAQWLTARSCARRLGANAKRIGLPRAQDHAQPTFAILVPALHSIPCVCTSRHRHQRSCFQPCLLSASSASYACASAIT